MELTRNRLLFTAAPLLLLAGTFVHPEEPTEANALYAVLQEDRGAWLVSHAVLLVGIVTLCPVLLRLAAAIHGTAPRLSRLSAVLGLAATGAAAAAFGGALTIVEAGRGSEPEMVALLDRVLGSPVQLVHLLLPGLIIAVAVTTGVLGATGVVSGVTAVLAPLGFITGLVAPEPFACFGLALLVVALWHVGGALDAREEIEARVPVSV